MPCNGGLNCVAGLTVRTRYAPSQRRIVVISCSSSTRRASRILGRWWLKTDRRQRRYMVAYSADSSYVLEPYRFRHDKTFMAWYTTWCDLMWCDVIRCHVRRTANNADAWHHRHSAYDTFRYKRYIREELISANMTERKKIGKSALEVLNEGTQGAKQNTNTLLAGTILP